MSALGGMKLEDRVLKVQRVQEFFTERKGSRVNKRVP